MYVQHAIEIQAVCRSLMKTPHIQQTDASPARSVTCGPPLKPRLKRFTSLYESGKKEEKNKTKERPKSMLLFVSYSDCYRMNKASHTCGF